MRYDYLLTKPLTSDITSRTRNTKKIILAIPAAAPATPPNPKIAAITAITNKAIVQRNIINCFKINNNES